MPSPGQKPLKDPREEAFVREYSRHGKKERAVVAAGYNAKTWREHGSTSAAVQANNLLKRERVLARLQWIQENRLNKIDYLEERILQELERIGTFDMRSLYDETGELKHPKDWDDAAAAAVSTIDVEKLYGVKDDGRRGQIGNLVRVKLHDKIAALEKMMRYFNMLEAPKENDKIGDTVFQQVNFYLPENPRHAKKLNGPDESISAEVIDAEPLPAEGGIQLPAKRPNGRDLTTAGATRAGLSEYCRHSFLWGRGRGRQDLDAASRADLP